MDPRYVSSTLWRTYLYTLMMKKYAKLIVQNPFTLLERGFEKHLYKTLFLRNFYSPLLPTCVQFQELDGVTLVLIRGVKIAHSPKLLFRRFWRERPSFWRLHAGLIWRFLVNSQLQQLWRTLPTTRVSPTILRPAQMLEFWD